MLVKKILPVAVSLALVGCGGGSGSVSKSLSGTVADGYLVGAEVCLDINRDKLCGAGEPTATTGAGGAYQMLVSGDIDVNAHPVIALVTESTVDEDTGETVAAGYVLSAPAGKPEFVSPLTTLVHAKQEANPVLTVDEAEQEVKQALGVTSAGVGLFDDYVAEKTDTINNDATERAEFNLLHNVAKVVARTVGAQLEQAVVSNGLSEDQKDLVTAIILEAVMAQIATIVQYVEQNTEAGKDDISAEALAVVEGDTSVTAAGSTELAAVTDSLETDQAALEAKEAELDAAASAVAVDQSTMQAVLQAGIYFFDAHTEYDATLNREVPVFEYEKITSDDAGNLSFTEYQYNASSGNFDPDTDTYSYYRLTETGWERVSDASSSESIVFNADGSATLSIGGVASETIRVTLSDVDGQFIKPMLPESFRDLVSSTATFTNGAQAMSFMFKSLTDRYEVGVWNDGDSTSSINHNRVYSDGISDAITTLDQLKSNYVNIARDRNLSARLLTTDAGVNIIEFYDVRSDLYGPTAAMPAPRAATGSWEERTVQGQAMIMFSLPDGIESNGGDEGAPFFVVQEGYVRQGEYYAAGVAEIEDGFDFNAIAKTDILAAIQAGPGAGSGSASTGEAVDLTANPVWYFLDQSGGIREDIVTTFNSNLTFTEYAVEYGSVPTSNLYTGDWSYDTTNAGLTLNYTGGFQVAGTLIGNTDGTATLIAREDGGVEFTNTAYPLGGFTAGELDGAWTTSVEGTDCSETITFSGASVTFVPTPECGEVEETLAYQLGAYGQLEILDGGTVISTVYKKQSSTATSLDLLIIDAESGVYSFETDTISR